MSLLTTKKLLLLLAFSYQVMMLCMILEHVESISQMRRNAAKSRVCRQRLSWVVFRDSLSDGQFRRMFRMSKECFELLCERIKVAVGEKSFKSDNYIKTVLNNNPMHIAHQFSSGGYICGEVKVALTLRMLAGGSYLDLSLIFHCDETYVYTIFHDVLEKWICRDDVINIPNESYFKDINKMRDVAKEFAAGRNGGILTGCIGALDGWLVKILKPSEVTDKVRNVAGYFSRKGFYAVNCQVIVDKKKRILWRSVKCRGGEHDSTAFKRTQLYQLLLADYRTFMTNGLYIIGDSAYALAVFLLKPFDNAAPYSEEDSCNFYISSARIQVECCFGEIDARWGIFWKPLSFSLENNLTVIDAAMRLHNFIVDFREGNNESPGVLRNEMDMFNLETVAALRDSDDTENDFIIGVHNDNTPAPSNPAHRPTNTEIVIRDAGIRLRQRICDIFAEQGMTRPDRYNTSSAYAYGQFNRMMEQDI